MTFELGMALDIFNGQIDRGVEFPEATLSSIWKCIPYLKMS